MNREPKLEPGSPSSNHVILDRDEDDEVGAFPMTTLDLEGMTIPDLVQVLLGSLQMETYERVEGVLVRRDLALKDQIQHLHKNVEMERQQLQMEKLSRLKAEEELKKREEICQKMKKVQESYNALLKEAKTAEKTHNKLKQESKETIEFLRKRNVGLKCEVDRLNEKKMEEDHELEVLRQKNGELECEVNKLEEERVEDGNKFDVLRKKNDELECEVNRLKEDMVEYGNKFEVLRKKSDELECEVNNLKEDRVEDGNKFEVLRKKNDDLKTEVNRLTEKTAEDGCELGVQRKVTGEMENKVLELTKLKEKWEEDCIVWAGIEIKNGELNETVNKNLATIRELRNENSKLANDKHNVDILLASWITKFRVLHEKVSRLEDDSKLLMSLNVSGGGNNERDPPVDFMAADSEEKDKEKESEVKDASSVGHVEVPAPIVAPSASQVDPVANAPVAIPYVPDPTNGNKRKSKSLHVKDVKKAKVRSSHVKDVKKAKVRSSHVKDVAKTKVRSSDRLRKLKTKMIAGLGKDASSPFVIEDSDEGDGIDKGDGIDD
ncbi:reticulocyte-binding protein 2 homolog a isoform X2 [Medicago truncatula]|uniref:reticulocyte-binding protein 2 homolog a isoform X2 n=1 Tax=Medicago truncatula TaxID=3880 RepID=UPI000D2F3D48|nr:reticulocyte-binding protein 2 homolog a isoform X2 [Medicago truncatula]